MLPSHYSFSKCLCFTALGLIVLHRKRLRIRQREIYTLFPHRKLTAAINNSLYNLQLVLLQFSLQVQQPCAQYIISEVILRCNLSSNVLCFSETPKVSPSFSLISFLTASSCINCSIDGAQWLSSLRH